MHLAMLNVSGLSSDPDKIKLLFQFLKNHAVDIAFLVELHIVEARAVVLLNDKYADRKVYTNSPYSNRMGVTAVVLNLNKVPTATTSICYTDEVGRSLGIKYKIEGSRGYRYILGVYARDGESENVNYFKALTVSQGITKADIVVADLNRVESAMN